MAACALGTVLCARLLPAAERSLAEEFSVTQIGRDFNFPFFTARSLVLARDGYLWIGGFTGLARFDGNTYQVFHRENTPELPDDMFVRLAVDGEGALWAGTSQHLVQYRNGR